MKITVKINGYSRDEGVREFEILDRERLEAIIDELDQAEIYKKTLRDAVSYNHSGNAYTYIDARNGNVATTWLEKGNLLHPWDSFYEIIVCDIETGYDNLDFNNPEYLLADNEEHEEFGKFEGTAEEFILEKFGKEELNERYDNLVEWLANEFEFDWQKINEQLDGLYSKIHEE